MKIVSLLLVTLLVCRSVVFADQGAPTLGTPPTQAHETPQAARVKREVQKRGIGEKSRVKVRLLNGIEVTGYISTIEEASFAVTDKKTGQATTISYAEVQKIQAPGLSKGAKIGIAVGLAAAVLVIVIAIQVAGALGGGA